MAERSLTLGIDIGGTKIEIVVINEDAEILTTVRMPTDVAGGPDAVMADIIQSIYELKIKLGNNLQYHAAGVAIAGQVSADTGNVSFAPNLNWRNVPLRQKLEEQLKLNVFVINDVRAATYAEWRLGQGQGLQDFICLLVGTGIGSGIVSGGKMLVGSNNAAGEVGHMTIDFKGRRCHCGKRGCFEALAGGRAWGETAREIISNSPSEGEAIIAAAGGKIANITAEHIAAAALKKDPMALKLCDQLREALIAGVCSLANIFNPKRIILGGGIIVGIPSLTVGLLADVKAEVLPAIGETLEIVNGAFLGVSVALGAALLAREQSL